MNYLKIVSGIILSASFGYSCQNTTEESSGNEKTEKPNIILYFCDDLGYGDLSCYGSEIHRTPTLDSIAKQGLQLTGFYAAAAVSTPSRAGILTGCYPKRVGLHENGEKYFRAVLTRRSQRGLNPDEITIADLLKQQGYATACLGKWHLGHHQPFLPSKHGFDYFYGFDNYPHGDSLKLFKNDSVIDYLRTRDFITRDLTQQAKRFISDNKEQPFFIYLPNPMPHVPIGASPKFKGKSANGIYGDAIEEIDWSVKQIVEHVNKLGLSKNTLLIFTSDNGAENYHRINEPVGGRNIPLHEWKGSSFEGGFRVPCIMYWPETIQAGTVSDELVTALDILPTLADFAKAKLPNDRIIDGISMVDFITGKTDTSPRESFYFYEREQLQAVRKGDWKLHLPKNDRFVYFFKEDTMKMDTILYNIDHDIAEQNNQAKELKEKVEELLELAEKAQNDLGDKNIPCTNCREPGFVKK